MTPIARRSLLSGAAAGATAFAVAHQSMAAGSARAHDSTEFGLVGDGVADDTLALQKLLDAAFDGRDAGLIRIPAGRYRVTAPLHVETADRPDGNITHPAGIVGEGAVLVSEVEGDAPIMSLDIRATLRFIRIEGVSFEGNGKEGAGLRVSCQKRGAYFYNFSLRDCVIEGCGGSGLELVGNIFEGQISNCYFRDNGRHGAYFAHGAEDTVFSAVHCFGCVFGGNASVGLLLKQGATDVSCYGCYFLLNGTHGLSADHGITLLSHCGFENNHQNAASFDGGDYGIRLFVAGTLVGCTAYSIYRQKGLLRGYITNELTMVGCQGAGSGDADDAGLADIDGDGRGAATLIGCHGKVRQGRGIARNKIGRSGVSVGGDWDSPNQLSLGDHHLWVDADGQLRIVRGRPESDEDGSVVGA